MGTAQFKGALTFGLFLTLAGLVATHKDRIDLTVALSGEAAPNTGSSCFLSPAYGLADGAVINLTAPGGELKSAILRGPGSLLGTSCRINLVIGGVPLIEGQYRIVAGGRTWSFEADDLRADHAIEIKLD